MRQHLSVLTLLTRSTIYPIAVLLAVMAAVEAVLFSLAMGANGTLSLTGMIRSSRIVWVFGAAFLLLTVLLCRTGCEFGSRQGYTLRRLSISERAVFAWQWGYNTACYLLLWWWQALIAFALCLWYASQAGPELVGSQTIFLAFYRSELLHSLIPLEEVSRWVRNGVMALGLGACAALEPFLQRRKKLFYKHFFIQCFFQSEMVNRFGIEGHFDLIHDRSGSVYRVQCGLIFEVIDGHRSALGEPDITVLGCRPSFLNL